MDSTMSNSGLLRVRSTGDTRFSKPQEGGWQIDLGLVGSWHLAPSGGPFLQPLQPRFRLDSRWPSPLSSPSASRLALGKPLFIPRAIAWLQAGFRFGSAALPTD